MSNIKACIFDLDGTLTNTINAIAHFGNIALAAFGLPEIPVEDYKIYVGDGRDKLIHRMLGVYGKDNAEMFEKVRVRFLSNSTPIILPNDIFETVSTRPNPLTTLADNTLPSRIS